MRLFFALRLGSQARSALAGLAVGLRRPGDGARWAPGEAHLTLAFLGEVPAEGFPRALRCGEAAASRAAPFSWGLEGLGAFPSWERLRILWAGVGPGAGAVRSLASDLRGALESSGFTQERRAFVPHVTLARVDSDSSGRALGELARSRAAVSFGPGEEARGFSLFESRSSPSGSLYEERASFPFGGAP
jgi:2'-5' RNA ligase